MSVFTQVISCCCDVKSHHMLWFHFAAFPADWPNLWPLISILTLMTDYTLCILLILLRVTHPKRFKKISAVHIVSDKRQIVTENNLLSIYDLLMATYTSPEVPQMGVNLRSQTDSSRSFAGYHIWLTLSDLLSFNTLCVWRRIKKKKRYLSSLLCREIPLISPTLLSLDKFLRHEIRAGSSHNKRICIISLLLCRLNYVGK